MFRSAPSLEDGGTPMTATCMRKSFHWLAGWLSNQVGKSTPCVAVIIMNDMCGDALISLDGNISECHDRWHQKVIQMDSRSLWFRKKHHWSPCCSCSSVIVRNSIKKVIKYGLVVCSRLINDTCTCRFLRLRSSTPSSSTFHSGYE